MRDTSLAARFDEKWTPEPFSGCWLWTAGTIKGYGAMKSRGKQVKAHRISWNLFRGAIPEGLWVLHRCDTPLCVNPEHLFLGTAKQNTHDSMKKGRRAIEERHGMAKLTPDVVRFIRSSTLRLKDLSERFGVARSVIGDAKNKRTWKNI